MKTVLLGAYRARQYGPRGVQVILPKKYIDDNSIITGDLLEMRINPERPNELIVIHNRLDKVEDGA